MCKIGKIYVIGLGPGAEKEMTYQRPRHWKKVRLLSDIPYIQD
mgnify:CR=1 FL=1